LSVIRVAVVTNVLPHYRAAFYERLFARDDLQVRVFCQATMPGMNLELVHHRFPEHVTLVRAAGMKHERLGWQWLPWRELLTSFDVLFLYGNPRVASSIALGALARWLGRRVVIWGQAHTASANARTEALRLWWWRHFENLFVYADGEVRWLRSRGFTSQHIVGMNNGLDQRRIDAVAVSWTEERLAGWLDQEGLSGRRLVLSCARLEPKNRFDLWLEAMPAVIAEHPDLLWCAIGDGREREALEARSRRAGLGGHVRWLGTILDEDELAPWFLASHALVHPDAIGLTLLHAFGYGLPVVTHDDPEAHMPEFGAFASGATGVTFPRGDPAGLADAVSRCLTDEEGRRRMGAEARRVARQEFNVDIMVERFAAIARHAARRR
jgi:glycosyltransferase involved in cell wall biosynthesis